MRVVDLIESGIRGATAITTPAITEVHKVTSIERLEALELSVDCFIIHSWSAVLNGHRLVGTYRVAHDLFHQDHSLVSIGQQASW